MVEFIVLDDYFASNWVLVSQTGVFCSALRADRPGIVTAAMGLVAGVEPFMFTTRWPQAGLGWEHGMVFLYNARADWASLMQQVTSFKLRLASDNPAVSAFDLDSVALQVAPAA